LSVEEDTVSYGYFLLHDIGLHYDLRLAFSFDDELFLDAAEGLTFLCDERLLVGVLTEQELVDLVQST
jgi:hypothetical protein